MKIHLIAPSGASPDLRSPESALLWLKQQGVMVSNSQCAQRVFERFAGTDAERLDELNAIANLDPSQIVLSVRGGYGLHRLLYLFFCIETQVCVFLQNFERRIWDRL